LEFLTALLRRTVTVAREVSEVDGAVTIEEPKTARSVRTFTAPRFVVEELAEHVRRHRPGAGRDDLLFVGAHGGTLRRSFLARTMRPAAAAAGLPASLTFHGLRHVAATLMVESGEHPRVIQHRLGHSTCRLSLELYAHTPEVADKAAAEHLEQSSRPGVARVWHGADPPDRNDSGKTPPDLHLCQWRRWGSNPRPPPCKGGALAS